jgi:hypothetical protein
MPACRLLLLLIASLLLSACGSIRYDLLGHSHRTLNTPVTLTVGEHRLALELPRRIPAPGGFELALASEDASIVSVEYQPGPGGSGTYTLVARATGTVTLHYLNRFSATAANTPEALAQLRQASLGAFTVTVQ